MSDRWLPVGNPMRGLSFVAALAIGLAVSTAYSAAIVTAVLIPALIFCNPTRASAWCTALFYYACAIWPVIPGARNFFGPRVSLFAALALWSIAAAVLSVPWAALWSPIRTQMLWRIPTALLLASVPPLGIIGWASPLTAAGFLFPATAWFGLLACAACATTLGVFPRASGVSAVLLAALANTIHPHIATPPSGWQAINTEFGAVAHSTLSPEEEYKIAETIQHKALSSRGSVIVFPETVVPYWTAATDQFWQRTIDTLRSERKTILVGALVSRSDRDRPMPQQIDFSAELAALKSGVLPLSPNGQQDRRTLDSGAPYFNALIVRGADRTSFRQRIPVPIAMWNPFSARGAPINLLGPGILKVRRERVAVLICYEQLLVWPVLASMAQRPTVIVAIANDHWATHTAIPRFQLSAVRAWSRLFAIPYLSAVNF
jgi:Carbon-nitrogen hydrolase